MSWKPEDTAPEGKWVLGWEYENRDWRPIACMRILLLDRVSWGWVGLENEYVHPILWHPLPEPPISRRKHECIRHTT